jgi:uncharacterized SAM-binding protein YcdF (DUF218 family)
MIRRLALLAAPALLGLALYLAWTAAGIERTARADQRPRSQAIVVMGAAQYDGKPSPIFRLRLDHARALYAEGVAPLVIVIGGKRPGDRFTEAEAGASYLERDLPAARVTGVKDGRTTRDSLEHLAGWARERGVRKIVIVSDPLHLARSREIARDLGFEVAVSASVSSVSPETRRTGLVRETLLLAAYRVSKTVGAGLGR